MHWLVVLSSILTASPYLFYSILYKYGRQIRNYCNQKTIIHVAQAVKIINFIVILPILNQAGVNGPGISIGLPLVFLGQYLIEIVYCYIGDAGTYYGLELGTIQRRKIDGFPFTLNDPMYKGVILTIIGATMCFNATRDLLFSVIPWIVMVFAQTIVENTKPSE